MGNGPGKQHYQSGEEIVKHNSAVAWWQYQKRLESLPEKQYICLIPPIQTETQGNFTPWTYSSRAKYRSNHVLITF